MSHHSSAMTLSSSSLDISHGHHLEGHQRNDHVPHLYTKHIDKSAGKDRMGELERILHRDYSRKLHQIDHQESSNLHNNVTGHKHFDYHSSHHLDEEEVETKTVHRPPECVGRLLKFKSDRDGAKKDVYAKFLLAADVATQDLVYAPINVMGSYKYSIVGEDKNSKVMNSSLMEIFMFYATLDQVYTATFDAAELQNETMNLRELHIMCEDLLIAPRLITYKELKVLWKGMAADRLNEALLHQEKAEPWNKMVYDDFLEFFVRMALYIYNKPGLKRLILSTSGFMPSPSEMVECLCSYLNLKNIYEVRNHIKTVGRATQGALNYRSAGEMGDASAMRNKQSSRDEDKANIDAARRKRDALKRSQGPLPTLANPGLHFSTTRRIDDVIPELVTMKSPSKRVRSRSELLTPAIYKRLYEGEGNIPLGGDEISHNQSQSEADENRKESEDALNDNAVGIDSDSDGEGNDDEEIGENGIPKYIFSTGRNKNNTRAIYSDNMKSSEAAIEEINSQYHVDLMRILQQYSYAPAERFAAGVSSSYGPYADMGSIPRGAECVVRLHITNRIDDDLRVDVICRGFECENARVTTFPSRLISGLTRPVSVSFTIEAAEKSVLGFIDITAISVRKKSLCVVSCPVYYNVEKANVFILGGTTAQQQCTIRTLPILLKKNLKITRSLDMNFENRSLNKSSRVNKTVNTLKKAGSVTALSNNNSVAMPSSDTYRPKTAL